MNAEGASSSALEEIDLQETPRDATSLLVVKNLLFWGSVVLTCTGLYAFASLLY